MKLNVTPRVNVDAETARWYREVAQQVNAISEGRVAGFYGASTAEPSSGTWAVGDFVLNSNPVELGAASSKYLVHGWRYTATGWLQCRFLTGN
jgi:hypothetical protein